MIIRLVAAAALVLAASQAAAQAPAAPAPLPTADAAVTSYPPSFFAESRPNSAFDMVQRLPGFNFSGGSNVRGFAGSGGNVLINGQRPTSKSVTLEAQLRRIPADTVARIDLIRGGAPGIDMQGQTLMANVIRSTDTVTTTAVTAGFRAYKNGWIGPRGGLEWSQRRGQLSLEASANIDVWESVQQGGAGDRLRYFPNGDLMEGGPYFNRRRGPLSVANASAELDKGSDIFRLNFGFQRTDESGPDRFLRYRPDGSFIAGQFVTNELLRDTWELGGDYEHLFENGLSARILALQTLRYETVLNNSEQPGLIQSSDREQNSRESILRGTLSFQPTATLALEGGLEGVLNVLDAESTIIRNGAPVVLPNANVRVEERRGEGFFTANWRPTSRLSVEAGLRAETSRISQTGDTEDARSFFFPKPRLFVAYSPDPLSQIRLRVERTVGQLTFTDFVASAEFTTGQATAGNPGLEPERAWVFEATVERRFWGRGSASLTLTHEELEQAIDRVPIDGRFDAPGNIGDGRRDTLTANLTLPLDRLGIAGGRLSSQVNWRWSEVTDPVTGRSRRISGERRVNGNLRFSHDVEAMRSTYGLEILMFGDPTTEYRINEIRRSSDNPYYYAYWEWKPNPGLSVRAEGRLLGGREFRRYRTLYTGPRSAGVVSEVEFLRFVRHPYLSVAVRKVF